MNDPLWQCNCIHGISINLRKIDYKKKIWVAVFHRTIFKHSTINVRKTFVCLISLMKLIKRIKKLRVKLNYRIRKSSFINNFHQQRKVMEVIVQFHGQKDKKEIIPSYLVIPSRLNLLVMARQPSHSAFYPIPLFTSTAH